MELVLPIYKNFKKTKKCTKMHKNAPKNTPKMHQKRHQNAPKNAPKMHQNAPKNAPKCAKKCTKMHQNAFFGLFLNIIYLITTRYMEYTELFCLVQKMPSSFRIVSQINTVKTLTCY
jgi:hypothetical protein